MTETWRPVPTHPGLYEVSDQGRVRPCDRVDHRGRAWKGRVLKPTVKGNGYRSVTLSVDGHPVTQKVAKLVAQAFCGPRPSMEHWVLHNNGDKLDDRAANLRWGTQKDNMEDALRHGVLMIGEHAPSAKLTDVEVLAIRHKHGRLTALELAHQYNVSRVAIYKIINCRRWRHLPPCNGDEMLLAA